MKIITISLMCLLFSFLYGSFAAEKKIPTYKIGDTIEFGHTIDKSKKLTWKIVSIDENEKTYTLFCDSIIDKRAYNKVNYDFLTWKQSDIRYYMNSELKYKIFDEDEITKLVKTKNNIKIFQINWITPYISSDEIYLLSENDIYQFNKKVSGKNINEFDIKDIDNYFLRDTVEKVSTYREFTVKIVDKKYRTKDAANFDEEHGIRPAITISFENNIDYNTYCENDKLYQASILNDIKAMTPFDRVEDENVLNINDAEYIIYDSTSGSDESYNKIRLGDIIKLGKCEQDNNINNGKEDIEWYVAKINNNKAMLMTKYMIDILRIDDEYATVPYNVSYERYYLHKYFYNDAFTEKEKDMILWSKTKYYRFTNHSIDPKSKNTEKCNSINKIFCPSIADFEHLKIKRFESTPYVKNYLSNISSLSAIGNQKCFLSDNILLAEETIRFPTYMSTGSEKINRIAGIFTLDSDMGVRLCVWVDLDKLESKSASFDKTVSSFSKTEEEQFYLIKNPDTNNKYIVDRKGKKLINTFTNDDDLKINNHDGNITFEYIRNAYYSQTHSYVYDKTGKNIIFDSFNMSDYRIVGDKVYYLQMDQEYETYCFLFDLNTKEVHEYGRCDSIYLKDKYVILTTASPDNKTIFIDNTSPQLTYGFDYTYDRCLDIDGKKVYVLRNDTIVRGDYNCLDGDSKFFNFLYDDMKLLFYTDVRIKTSNDTEVDDEMLKKSFRRALKTIPQNNVINMNDNAKTIFILEYMTDTNVTDTYDDYNACFDKEANIDYRRKYAYIKQIDNKYIIDVSNSIKHSFDAPIYLLSGNTATLLQRNIFYTSKNGKSVYFNIINNNVNYIDENATYIGNDGYYLKNGDGVCEIVDSVSNDKIYVAKDVNTFIVENIDDKKYFFCGSKSYKRKYCDIYDMNGKSLYMGVTYDYLDKKDDKNNDKSEKDNDNKEENYRIIDAIDNNKGSFDIKNYNDKYILKDVIHFIKYDFGISYSRGFKFGLVDYDGNVIGEYPIFDSFGENYVYREFYK